MRRLAAVFTKRDKSDSHHQSDHSHPPSSQPFKKHLKLPLTLSFVSSPQVRTPSSITSTPQPSSVSDHGQSSGSSSGSASLSLPTPEDDPQATSLGRSSTRRSWKEWLGGKRPEPDLPAPPELPKPSGWDGLPMPVWEERPPTLQGPRARVQMHKKVDDADEDSPEETDEEESLFVPDCPRSPITKHTFVPSLERARQNLELSINYGLNTPLPTPPFLQHSPTYIFPRSINRPCHLPVVCDTRRVMFKRRLLKRLGNLTGDDKETILPFASKNVPISTPNPLPGHEEMYPSKTAQIFAASPGVRRWISRPCFEDRFSVFLPSEDGTRQTPVVGTLAVTALEYSEYLDAMVDPDFDPSSPPPELSQDIPWAPSLQDLSPNQSPLLNVSSDSSPQPPAANVRHSYIPSPSPLRNQHKKDVSLSESMSQSTIIPSASSQTRKTVPAPTIPPHAQTPVAVPVKRAVRFVEDDAEDAMPLYLVRQKKKQEEKAKFLRAEQRKRLMEQEQERRKQEAEIMDQERKRMAREKARREMEQRQYTELVASTRLRRETQRSGVVPGLKLDSSGILLTSSPSTTSMGEAERNRSRDSRASSLMPHPLGSSSSIPRREGSDSALSPSRPHSAETSSYRTGSGGYSPGNSTSGHGHPSRPGSMYSSSSEDGRPSSRRHSNIANSLNRPPFNDRTASYPMWSGSSQSLHHLSSVPGLPAMPELMNDFVLLPPSAPFMMQSGRQSRNSSPGRSTSSGSLRGGSANSSSERVHMHRQSSPRPKETSSAPASPGTSPSRMESRPAHTRSGSGDSRRASMPLPSSSLNSAPRSQPSSSSRGRPPMSHVQTAPVVSPYQSPNPWTALPTQRGYLPTAMPVSPYSHQIGPSTSSKGSLSSGAHRGKGM